MIENTTPRIEIKHDPDQATFRWAAPSMVRDSTPAWRKANNCGQIADKHYMTIDHCILYLSRRVSDVRAARARSNSIFGRIKNYLTGEDTNAVALSGAVCAIVMKYVGDPVPDEFDRGEDYNIRFEIAENLMNRMLLKARSEGLIK